MVVNYRLLTKNILLSIGLLLCAALAGATPAVPTPPSAEELISALQGGGHIIYMRHSPTDHTQKDDNPTDFDDCASQRNLSEKGRQIARAINQHIESLQIPIGAVYSSPYCRCKNTAELTFKKFSVVNDLQFSMSKNKEETEFLGRRLLELMQATTVGNDNTVFVGHTANLREGLGIWPKPEGVWTIFQKHGDNIIFKGMITPDEWPDA